MRFTKMHGLGNDYVYVNCFEETVEDPAQIARLVSDRHFGIGSDGLILIKPSEVADFCMEMYNADGSRGAMCGNGIRCVAKYVYDHALTNMTKITVETGAGIKTLQLLVKNGKVSQVTVDMGAPVLTNHGAQLDLSGADAENLKQEEIWETLCVDGTNYQVINISMGNPHTIVFCENIAALKLEEIGPKFEMHERFADRTNTEFVEIVDETHAKMRVWERGSGETMACGTGATAVGVACRLAGHTGRQTEVKLLGGVLKINWDKETGHAFMTGSATEVFNGEIDL